MGKSMGLLGEFLRAHLISIICSIPTVYETILFVHGAGEADKWALFISFFASAYILEKKVESIRTATKENNEIAASAITSGALLGAAQDKRMGQDKSIITGSLHRTLSDMFHHIKNINLKLNTPSERILIDDQSLINTYLKHLSDIMPNGVLWLGVTKLTDGWIKKYSEIGFDDFISTIETRSLNGQVKVVRIYCAEKESDLTRIAPHLINQVAQGVLVYTCTMKIGDPPSKDISILYSIPSFKTVDLSQVPVKGHEAFHEHVRRQLNPMLALHFGTKAGIFLNTMEIISPESDFFVEQRMHFFSIISKARHLSDLEIQWLQTKRNLEEQGYALIPPNLAQIPAGLLDNLRAQIDISNFKPVRVGDTREGCDVEVARYIVDRIEHRDNCLANKSNLPEIENFISQEAVRSIISRFSSGNEGAVIRCQANRYREGGFVSRHTDRASNNTIDYTLIFNLSKDGEFEGGDLKIKEIDETIPHFKLLVLNGGVPHKVSRVTKGVRRTFLCFISNTNDQRLMDYNASERKES